jgi:hypothetical protein
MCRRWRYLLMLGPLIVMVTIVVAWRIGAFDGHSTTTSSIIIIDDPDMRRRLETLMGGAAPGEKVGRLGDLTSFRWEVAYAFIERTTGAEIRQVAGDFPADDQWIVPDDSSLFIFQEGNDATVLALLTDVELHFTKTVLSWSPETVLMASVPTSGETSRTKYFVRLVN